MAGINKRSFVPRGGRFYFTGVLASEMHIDSGATRFSRQALDIIEAAVKPGYPIKGMLPNGGSVTLGSVGRCKYECGRLMVYGYVTVECIPLASGLSLMTHGKYSHFEVEVLKPDEDLPPVSVTTIKDFELDGVYLGVRNSDPEIGPIEVESAKTYQWN